MSTWAPSTCTCVFDVERWEDEFNSASFTVITKGEEHASIMTPSLLWQTCRDEGALRSASVDTLDGLYPLPIIYDDSQNPIRDESVLVITWDANRVLHIHDREIGAPEHVVVQIEMDNVYGIGKVVMEAA